MTKTNDFATCLASSVDPPAWANVARVEEVRQLAISLGASACVAHWLKGEGPQQGEHENVAVAYHMSDGGKTYEISLCTGSPRLFDRFLDMIEQEIRWHLRGRPSAAQAGAPS